MVLHCCIEETASKFEGEQRSRGAEVDQASTVHGTEIV
jgi:hypothetical protein